MKFNGIIIAFVLATLVSCKSKDEKNNENNELNNTEESSGNMITESYWALETLEGNKVKAPSEAGREIGFQLEETENRISGFAGCNNFMGSYTLEADNKINFSKLASTRMACPENTFNESEFLGKLEQTDHFKISGEKLELFNAQDEIVATFKKAEKKMAELVEKHWKLKTLEGKEIKMGEYQEQEVFFILKANENRISGFSGCNNFSGSYTIEGNQISFDKVVSTLKACPEVEFNEQEFLKLFQAPVTYELSEDTLVLKTEDGTKAVFEAFYF